MQVRTLSAEFSFGSELFDWYLDATSVPYGDFLIDLSPRTDDRLRYCTSTGSIPSKYYITDQLKESKFLDYEHTKFLYCPTTPITFPQMQSSFPSVLPKRVHEVPLRMYSKSSQRKPAKQKRHHVTKFQNEVPLFSLKTITWKQRRDFLASEKGLELLKVIFLPVINHLS